MLDTIVNSISNAWEYFLEAILAPQLRIAINEYLYIVFSTVNDGVSETATLASATPNNWNTTIYNFVETVSNTVVLPIGGMIISAILCYELVSMVISKNNMHEVDSGMLFVYLFKACISVLLLSYSFDIVMACFDVGSSLVKSVASLVTGSNGIAVSTAYLNDMPNQLEKITSIGTLLSLMYRASLLSVLTQGIHYFVLVLVYSRMIEIYFYLAVVPVPFATLGNREWGSIGTNYVRSIAALAFQAFFIMLSLGIYEQLIANFLTTDDLSTAMWEACFYLFLLAFSMLKIPSISRSIFNAH